MIEIPLQRLPNQSFFITLDNNQWNFALKTTNGIISASVSLNGVVILSNMRCVANQIIIPSVYLESGNFLFLTQDFQLPYYTEFGVTQKLIYLTSGELAQFRAKPTLPITTNDFNPIASLPLRFSPQGYREPTPIDIGGLFVWYDLSNAIYLQNGSDVAPSPGEGIKKALDRSGYGNDTIVQANIGSRATFTSGQINGLPAAVFDGGDFLNLPSTLYPLVNGNNTIFAVSRSSSDTTQQRILAGAESGGARLTLEYGTTTGQVVYLNNITNTGGVGVNGITKSNFNIFSAFFRGTIQSLAVNNGASSTNATGAAENGVNAMRMGMGAVGGAGLIGSIAEILWYNRALYAAEITQVNLYLAKKYAILIS